MSERLTRSQDTDLTLSDLYDKLDWSGAENVAKEYDEGNEASIPEKYKPSMGFIRTYRCAIIDSALHGVDGDRQNVAIGWLKAYGVWDDILKILKEHGISWRLSIDKGA